MTMNKLNYYVCIYIFLMFVRHAGIAMYNQTFNGSVISRTTMLIIFFFPIQKMILFDVIL